MSKSRLEKFLYALYSLDSSNLPTPLSRIEELYKCWVTGEKVPSFKPLSRVEKYLMVILGLYDLETQVEQRVLCTENNDVIVDENENYICLDEVTSGGIPAPISRIEKLLYKLAIGDDNLDDIKSFLSKHEELLADIIRNGGTGGNIDIEYVLYTLSTEFNTLYNTTEKPIKSAILKGNTLVNLMITGEKTKTATGSYVGMFEPSTSFAQELKTNTQYLYIVDIIETTLVGGNKAIEIGNTDGGQLSAFTNNVKFPADSKGMLKCVLTTRDSFNGIFTVLRNQLNGNAKSGSITYRQMLIEYQDGMENWDIPYFEGIKSVQMPVLTTTGFNLFDGVLANGGIGDSTGGVIAGNSPVHKHTKNFIKVSQNDNLCVYYESDGYAGASKAYFYDKNKNYLKLNMDISSKSTTSKVITVPNDANICYMKIRFFSSNNNEVKPKNIIIAKTDNVITAYENYEYKTNILTTSEEVELRGIGDVKDELNLITGELTQHINEIILNGDDSNNIQYYTPQEMDNTVMIFAKADNGINQTSAASCLSDKIPSRVAWSEDMEGIWLHSGDDDKRIRFRLAKSKLLSYDLNGVKQYLKSNPITLQYKTTQSPIKTVDLSTVDQDGKNTKLSTFNDITHVTLSSEGLIPEAELEVATKNEEVLNTMSLEMDDIFTTQTTLGETVNTQSENVDATMIATTEIYEGLL